MKLSKRQLKRIIQEEKTKLLKEGAEGQMAILSTKVLGWGQQSTAAVPLSWVAQYAEPDDVVSIEDAEQMDIEIFYEGSHHDLNSIEDIYAVASILNMLVDEGLIKNPEIAASVFH